MCGNDINYCRENRLRNPKKDRSFRRISSSGHDRDRRWMLPANHHESNTAKMERPKVNVLKNPNHVCIKNPKPRRLQKVNISCVDTLLNV